MAGQKPLKDNPDPKYRRPGEPSATLQNPECWKVKSRPQTSEKEASHKGTKFLTFCLSSYKSKQLFFTVYFDALVSKTVRHIVFCRKLNKRRLEIGRYKQHTPLYTKEPNNALE